jgi:hypothetical protein
MGQLIFISLFTLLRYAVTVCKLVILLHAIDISLKGGMLKPSSSCQNPYIKHANVKRNRDERLAWGLMIDTSPAIEQTNPANKDVKLDYNLLHFNFLPPNCTTVCCIFTGSIKKPSPYFFLIYTLPWSILPLINKENNTRDSRG